MIPFLAICAVFIFSCGICFGRDVERYSRERKARNRFPAPRFPRH